MIDRKHFWNNFPFRPVKQKQVNAINFILDKLDSSKVLIKDPRYYAYILATIKWETAETYLPIKEYGSMAYLKNKPYYPYIGRGFVQLTWETNYKKFQKILSIDLVAKPSLAEEPETAWKILEIGMTKGLFTGKSLGDYFNGHKTDWINARKIINGLDRAELIAGYAKQFYSAIFIKATG